MTTQAAESGQGHPGGDLPGPRWYEVTIAERKPGDQLVGSRVEGGPKPVAAFLRAVANELDPPPAVIQADPGEGTFPAQGLRTDRRGTPDHKDRQGFGNRYFGPVTA